MFKILILTFLLFTSLKASTCPQESIEWKKSCYIFQTDSTGFAKAEENCAEINGDIVSIHDGFTNALLAQESVGYFHDSSVTDFWIGLTSLMAPGNWTWMDKTVFDFKNWNKGEPSNETGASKSICLSITDGFWRADDCFKVKPYVCKIDKTSLQSSTVVFKTTTSKITTKSFDSCPKEFVYFQPSHSCYSNTTYLFSSWNSSEKYCQSLGGHLVSMHSDNEKLYLTSYCSKSAGDAYRYWTGAYSNDYGKTWLWSDGIAWDFNPWGWGNNGTGYCNFMDYSGIYNDACNSGPYKGICKIKL